MKNLHMPDNLTEKTKVSQMVFKHNMQKFAQQSKKVNKCQKFPFLNSLDKLVTKINGVGLK
jgi:hypothetical protein